ncbi:hypothetical protein MP228_001122 [Amoeboaphelidium protococcarum]|nr:hypothetical protein MP228_001122 [Amoeboaphelidium protococcarum]
MDFSKLKGGQLQSDQPKGGNSISHQDHKNRQYSVSNGLKVEVEELCNFTSFFDDSCDNWIQYEDNQHQVGDEVTLLKGLSPSISDYQVDLQSARGRSRSCRVVSSEKGANEAADETTRQLSQMPTLILPQKYVDELGDQYFTHVNLESAKFNEVALFDSQALQIGLKCLHDHYIDCPDVFGIVAVPTVKKLVNSWYFCFWIFGKDSCGNDCSFPTNQVQCSQQQAHSIIHNEIPLTNIFDGFTLEHMVSSLILSIELMQNKLQ